VKGKASGAELAVKVSQQQRSPEDLLEAVLGAVSAQLPEGQALIVAMDEVPLALQNIIESNENGPRDAGLLLQHLRSA